MESYIPISFLNDFIFCPRSIYFHQLYGKQEQISYQDTPQIAGKAAHQTIDSKSYSTRKNTLQGIPVYSHKYKLHGKIDIFNNDTGLLTEHKKRIKVIYDGYIMQIYAQYHCLIEMNYQVKQLRLYSMDTNKNYPIDLPKDDPAMQSQFEKLIEDISAYSLNQPFQANPKKCAMCIYNNLCDKRAA